MAGQMSQFVFDDCAYGTRINIRVIVESKSERGLQLVYVQDHQAMGVLWGLVGFLLMWTFCDSTYPPQTSPETFVKHTLHTWMQYMILQLQFPSQYSLAMLSQLQAVIHTPDTIRL